MKLPIAKKNKNLFHMDLKVAAEDLPKPFFSLIHIALVSALLTRLSVFNFNLST